MPCTAKSNAFRNALLELIFKNTTFAGIGDATGIEGSGAAGNLYVALHTADPGDAGNQSTSECAYTSYARVAVARSGAGWTVTTNTVENAAAVDFPEATGGSETATHFSVGLASAGAGVILYSEELTTPLAISAGVQPRFAAGALVGTET